MRKIRISTLDIIGKEIVANRIQLHSDEKNHSLGKNPYL